MRFLLGNHVMRFSKVKFCLITELRFRVVPDMSLYAAVENGIHQQYFLGADDVSLEEFMVVLTLGEFQEVYDAVKLCLIYMLNWIIMSSREGSKEEGKGVRHSEMETSDPSGLGFSTRTLTDQSRLLDE
ncbi:hypothetical protein Ddye_004929 [Dipteronia dyeriana]|uniref:Uncharacterized protein n=1 Tax=Dipteronia dyeriana TaxID=168575 RepID=A0AAD9XF72_9ROSI|nr:hypothetical protein Ddye_004929 [Dipteronia dyeriana]